LSQSEQNYFGVSRNQMRRSLELTSGIVSVCAQRAHAKIKAGMIWPMDFAVTALHPARVAAQVRDSVAGSAAQPYAL